MAEDARDAEQRRRRAEGDRVRAVREGLGENQPAFAQRLTEEARRVGMIWLRYDNTIVSKLELGTRSLALDDAMVIAGVDPEHRGVLWLAWGNIALPQKTAPYRPPMAEGKIVTPSVPAETVAPKRRRAGGK